MTGNLNKQMAGGEKKRIKALQCCHYMPSHSTRLKGKYIIVITNMSKVQIQISPNVGVRKKGVGQINREMELLYLPFWGL